MGARPGEKSPENADSPIANTQKGPQPGKVMLSEIRLSRQSSRVRMKTDIGQDEAGRSDVGQM